jgi:hypothetical protein
MTACRAWRGSRKLFTVDFLKRTMNTGGAWVGTTTKGPKLTGTPLGAWQRSLDRDDAWPADDFATGRLVLSVVAAISGDLDVIRAKMSEWILKRQ